MDDDYWNTSDVSSGFNFDDDAFHQLSDQLNRAVGSTGGDTDSLGAGDSIDVEVVDWSGAPIGGKKISSTGQSSFPSHQSNSSSQNSVQLSAVRFNVSSNSLGISENTATKSPAPAKTASSESFPSKRFGASLSPELSRRIGAKSDISSTSFGSGGSSYGDTDSISRAVASPRKEFSPADFSRLDSAFKDLTKKFERLRRDRYTAPDTRETIKRLLKGEPVILEFYRTKEDKVQLLNAAIKSGDGNVMTKIVLFLKETFSYSMFQEQLLKSPIAANHYVYYLREHYRMEELVTMLYSLGRREEAAMVEFRQACLKQPATNKVAGLKKSLQSSFADPSLNSEAQAVTEYVSLLERQQPIDHSDDQTANSGRDARFKIYPKVTTVVDQPVLTTLYYCALYHYELPQNSFASPLSMKQHHKLTEKQYSWVCTKALARQKKWPEIEKLLTAKAFFGMGGSKIKSPVPYEKLLVIVEKHGAGPDVLKRYVDCISDMEERLQAAKKFKCHHTAIDCMVSLRDRMQLAKYIGTLTKHTKEFYYAEGALQNVSYNWKN